MIEQLESEKDGLEKELKNQKLEKDKLTLHHERTIADFKEQSKLTVDEVLINDNKRLKEDVSNLTIKNSEQQSEIERLRLSLSKIAGEKMLEGNPSITDLSDSHRPQKLAEKFNSLYDNSWTDAFEVLSKTIENEEDTCKTLLQILQKCWSLCVNVAEEQLEVLKVAFACPPQSKEGNKEDLLAHFHNRQSRFIQETRRLCAQQFIPNLYKHYWEQSDKKETEQPVTPYVEACLDLCWYSVITDPQIDYDFAVDDAANFRGYTSSGDSIDYVVWPAMFLHKHGPLLYKGVVQYKNVDKTEQ